MGSEPMREGQGTPEGGLAEALRDLQGLNGRQLRQRWQQAYGSPAPKRVSRELLLRALAHHLQLKGQKGLGKAIMGRLDALTGGKESKSRKLRLDHLKSGVRLVREWNRETHHVMVLDGGFEYRGSRYVSLSKIARTITGSRWSGPAFFGLRDKDVSQGEKPYAE